MRQCETWCIARHCCLLSGLCTNVALVCVNKSPTQICTNGSTCKKILLPCILRIWITPYLLPTLPHQWYTLVTEKCVSLNMVSIIAPHRLDLQWLWICWNIVRTSFSHDWFTCLMSYCGRHLLLMRLFFSLCGKQKSLFRLLRVSAWYCFPSLHFCLFCYRIVNDNYFFYSWPLRYCPKRFD